MSQEIQEQLHKQQEVIADKQMSVKEDLDKVEPAVIEAQNGMCARSAPTFPGRVLALHYCRLEGTEHKLPSEVLGVHVSRASLVNI